MKIILCFLLAATLSLDRSFAQGTVEDRKDLQDLLEVRRSMFDSYSESIMKRSGIFGNKTKNDVQKSNEVLELIIETDNKIITSLNRVVDFRKFEKTSQNYDRYEDRQQLDNLRMATDTLTKQLDMVVIQNAKLKRSLANFKWLSSGLLLGIGWLLLKRLTKQKKNTV